MDGVGASGDARDAATALRNFGIAALTAAMCHVRPEERTRWQDRARSVEAAGDEEYREWLRETAEEVWRLEIPSGAALAAAVHCLESGSYETEDRLEYDRFAQAVARICTRFGGADLGTVLVAEGYSVEEAMTAAAKISAVRGEQAR